MLTSPGLGHIIPFVELAKRLVNQHSFNITFIIPGGDASQSKAQIAVLNSLPSSTTTVFLPPPDLSDLPSTTRIETRVSHTMARSNQALRELFRSLSDNKRLPTVIVVDLFGTDAFDVAVEFHVAPYIFYASNANVLSFFLHIPKLDETVPGNLKDLTEPVKIPGCIRITGKDLLDAVQERKDDAYECFVRITKRYKEAKGILVNSFIDLEPNAINALQEPGSDKPPVYPIGPLVYTSSSDVNRNECLNWLDNQPLSSVLFVSFGSGGTLSYEQFNEVALGLMESGERFIWIIRSPSERADSSYFNPLTQTDPLSFLPQGFLDRTKEKGLLVESWAPQIEILNHPSTGGFLTHCGWNSSLESIVSNVPIIAWPLYAEQKMNALVLVEDVGVALGVRGGEDGIVSKEEVVRVVKELMEGEEGNVVRNRMRKMNEGAVRVLRDDGFSMKSLIEVSLKWKAHQLEIDQETAR